MPTTLEQIQYGFDRDSRRTWQKRPLSTTQDQHYSYDALSQVIAAARGSLNLNLTAISGVPAAQESWDYDPTGNWRGYHSAANGVSTLDQHRVHDRGNRLTQIEDNPNNMILDRVGRMRQMAPDAGGDWDGRLEITWDAWSRITSVKNNGTVVGEYSYDGTHRRLTREVGGETLHSYYNDAWRPVEERKESATTASTSYLWGARHRDDLVRRDRATSGTSLNETRYVLMDYFNPAAITDESGEIKECYAFSAFGVRTILNPDFTIRSSSECGMEFAFQGQFLDAESGLINYGYRYYSPYLGRWTCKDPIGEKGGFNLYRAGSNNMLNWVDFLGLDDGGLSEYQGVSNDDLDQRHKELSGKRLTKEETAEKRKIEKEQKYRDQRNKGKQRGQGRFRSPAGMAFLFALDEMATEQGDETGSVFTWEWWFGAEKVMATCSEIDCRCWSCECPDGYTVMPGFLPPETRGNCPNGGFYSEAEPEIECIAEEAMKNFG